MISRLLPFFTLQFLQSVTVTSVHHTKIRAETEMNLAERHASELWKRSAPGQPQRIRRRSLLSMSKVVKYCFITLLLLFTIAVYKQRDAFPGPSGMMAPATSDQAASISEKPITSILSGSYAQEEGTPERNKPTLPDQINHTTLFYPRFGKCTASFGDPDPPYEAAIASHELHNQIHGYPHYILREHMIRGLWSKHGWIITVLGQELSKPEAQRLQWLLWHDRDTVLMNPQIPLDIFVPPEENFAHINLLVTKDRNGLNNGVFMVRVSQWAMKMFASALSIREYQPDVVLKYTEQSGMEETIKRVRASPSPAFDDALTLVASRGGMVALRMYRNAGSTASRPTPI